METCHFRTRWGPLARETRSEPRERATLSGLDRLSRYAQRFERSLYRATAELRNLQTGRAARNTVSARESEALPPMASVERLESAKRTHAAARTESVRAELAGIDLEVARNLGRVPAGGVVPSLLENRTWAAAIS